MSTERRAPVQAVYWPNKRPAGTISWAEHLEAYAEYVRRFGIYQSAERIAERGGFGYDELTDYLGHEPRTWQVRPI